MKRDPYKHEEQWLRWKDKNKDRILEISKENSDLVLDYLKDMEMGINTFFSKEKIYYATLKTLYPFLTFLFTFIPISSPFLAFSTFSC